MPKINSKDKITAKLKIIDMDTKCRGVGRLDDGRVVFVPFSISDETVTATLQAVKSSYAVAKIDQILESSPSRTIPPCPVFETCGGCAALHIDYPSQLEIKTNIIASQLKKIAGISDIDVSNCRPSPLIYSYRNKAVFRFFTKDDKTEMGFLEEGSHKVVGHDYCYICSEGINKAAKLIKQFVNNLPTNNSKSTTSNAASSNIQSVTIRELNNSILINFQMGKLISLDITSFVANLERHFTDYGIFQTAIVGGKTVVRHLAGSKTISSKTLDIKYKISLDAFLQVNSGVAEKLYADAIELANIGKNDIIVDAYSGIGILSAMMAKQAHFVYAIEIIEAATDNARKLAKNNNIDNIQVLTGDCSVIVPKVLKEIRLGQSGKRVTVVLDPPRKGCSSEVVAAILDSMPDKIVYISCDSATLCRDLKRLAEKYRLVSITPYDMFPHTADIETLAFLEKNINAI